MLQMFKQLLKPGVVVQLGAKKRFKTGILIGNSQRYCDCRAIDKAEKCTKVLSLGSSKIHSFEAFEVRLDKVLM